MGAIGAGLLFKLRQQKLGPWACFAGIGQMGTAEVAGGDGCIRRQLSGEQVEMGLGELAALVSAADGAIANLPPTGRHRPLLLMVLAEAIGFRRGGRQ